MKLFARAKKAPAPKESMAKLRETLDMLEKREAYLQKKVEKELLVAKQNATKNKRAALAALKRKKTYESQMEKMAGARATIETQVMAIENASVSLEAMNAMRQGAEAMKTIHRNMTIEDVDNTMEEIREQMDLANEISDAIAQPLGDQYDEDELQAELAALEEEALDEQFLGSRPALDSMPAVPQAAPAAAPAAKAAAAASVADDAEFRALAEGMAM